MSIPTLLDDARTVPAVPDRTFRYGRIIIEGNTDTPDSVILNQLQCYPGQRITVPAVWSAEERLRTCGVFKSNPWQGTGPTIKLLPSEFDSIFWDVQVLVEEKPGNWFVFGLSGLILSAVNLDPDGVVDELDRLRRGFTERRGPE